MWATRSMWAGLLDPAALSEFDETQETYAMVLTAVGICSCVYVHVRVLVRLCNFTYACVCACLFVLVYV